MERIFFWVVSEMMLFAFGKAAEINLPQWSGEAWIIIAFAMLALTLFLGFQWRSELAGDGTAGSTRARKSKWEFSDFDMSIREALDHIVSTSTHSYTSTGRAEQSAFRSLHERMCAGTLPVIGRYGEFAPHKRISTDECRKLLPREVVVPRSPTSPEGVLFALIDDASGTPGVETSGPIGFTDLRIRRQDVYRMGPLVKVLGGEGAE